MRNLVSMYIERFRRERRTRKQLASVLLALAVAVTGFVFWQLHYTGEALVQETDSGYEEEESPVCDEFCAGDVLLEEIPEQVPPDECVSGEEADSGGFIEEEFIVEGKEEIEEIEEITPGFRENENVRDSSVGEDEEEISAPGSDLDEAGRGDGDLMDDEEEETDEIPRPDDSSGDDSGFLRYTASDRGVTVEVTALEGSLPEGAELAVVRLREDSEEYAEALSLAEEAAEAEEDEAASEEAEEEAESGTLILEGPEEEPESGTAVLDIGFWLDGEEIEPAQPVEVHLDFSSLLEPEEKMDHLDVRHIVESEDGKQAVRVEDTQEDSDGTAFPGEGTVQFETDSFSVYTLYWEYESYSWSIRVEFNRLEDAGKGRNESRTDLTGISSNYKLKAEDDGTVTVNIEELVDSLIWSDSKKDAYSFVFASVSNRNYDDEWGTADDPAATVTTALDETGKQTFETRNADGDLLVSNLGKESSYANSGGYFHINLYFAEAYDLITWQAGDNSGRWSFVYYEIRDVANGQNLAGGQDLTKQGWNSPIVLTEGNFLRNISVIGYKYAYATVTCPGEDNPLGTPENPVTQIAVSGIDDEARWTYVVYSGDTELLETTIQGTTGSTSAPDPARDLRLTLYYESDLSVVWSANSNTDGSRSQSVGIIPYFDGIEDPSLASSLSGLVVSYRNEVRFREEDNELFRVDGFYLEDAKLRIGDSTETIDVYSITKMIDWNTRAWTYTYKYYDSSGTLQEMNSDTADVSMTVELYYVSVETEATGDLTIVDRIPVNGCLRAVYTGEYADENNFRGDYYYHWFILDGTDAQGEEIWKAYQGVVSDSLSVYSFGARQTFLVELVRVKDDAVVAKSNAFMVPYYDELQNGSFENPALTSSDQVTNGLYPELVWHTTGFGSLNTAKGCEGQDIEIIVGGASASEAYGVRDARDGRQFVELNCEYDGTLYQDILTAPGNTMYWSLSHQARFVWGRTSKTSIDTMCVIAVSTLQAEDHIVNQNDIDAMVSAAFPQYNGNYSSRTDGTVDYRELNYTFPDGTEAIVHIWLITSDNTGWHDYSGSFTVPEGQYLTRFLFGAVYTTSSSSGEHTLGNLIDAVALSPMPTPEPEQGNLIVTKELSGVSANTVVPAGTFHFEVYLYDTDVGGEVTGTERYEISLPTQNATPLDRAYWTVTWTNEKFLAGTYQVEETYYDIDGYTYVVGSTRYEIEHSGEVSESETSGQGLTTNHFLVYGNEYTSVTFTNAYVPGEFTMRKVDSLDDERLEGAVFTVTDEKGQTVWFTVGTEWDEETEKSRTVYTVVPEETDGAVQSVTFGEAVIRGLPGNTYTLTETEAPERYRLLTQPVVFTFEEGVIRVESGDAYVRANDALTLVIQNTDSAELPNTGGRGTGRFLLPGILLMGFSAGRILNRRRRVRA